MVVRCCHLIKKILKCNKWNSKISSVFCNRLSIIGIGLVWWASLELFAFIFCSTLWCIRNVLCIALSLMINIYILHLCLLQILIKTQIYENIKKICMKYEKMKWTFHIKPQLVQHSVAAQYIVCLCLFHRDAVHSELSTDFGKEETTRSFYLHALDC